MDKVNDNWLICRQIDDVRAQPIRPWKPIRNNSTRADIVANYFDDYQRLQKIHDFLAAIQSKYPSIAATESIGKSYQGKDLRIIRIGVNQASKTKPVIFMESGIHAREWISPATTQCFAQNLVQGYEANNADIVNLLQKFDFIILPSLNPDG